MLLNILRKCGVNLVMIRWKMTEMTAFVRSRFKHTLWVGGEGVMNERTLSVALYARIFLLWSVRSYLMAQFWHDPLQYSHITEVFINKQKKCHKNSKVSSLAKEIESHETMLTEFIQMLWTRAFRKVVSNNSNDSFDWLDSCNSPNYRNHQI